MEHPDISKNIENDALTKIKDWILVTNPAITDLSLDTDIIENRLIDSLQFVSFLLYIEEVRGARIPPDQIKPDSFRTLYSIRDCFLVEKSHG